MDPEQNAELGLTQIKRIEQYKDRWTSYGANTGMLELSEKLSPAQLQKFDIFQEYDVKFLERISADVSLARWKKDVVLFEEGSYIDLAFFVVQGAVEIYLAKEGLDVRQGQTIFDTSRTMLASPTAAREQNGASESMFLTQIKKQQKSGDTIMFLATLDFALPLGEKMKLGPGEILGEIGALSGWPQSVTARTASECELIQVRLPALRAMRNKSRALKNRLDKIYRERSLAAQLRTTPLFRECETSFMEALCKKVELVSCEPDEIIAAEGELAEALFLVRSGFVKLSQKLGTGQIAASYLSKGMTLGEAELLLKDLPGWHCTASSVENTELVKISREDFYQILKKYPAIERLLWQEVVARVKETGASRKNITQSEFIETALYKGLVEGSSILVIDLNTCTRCDDCVRGCADTHGGLPRFVREGDRYKNFLLTRACYHCYDPVCLIGCPTGAIRRASVDNVVEIDAALCIGCENCVRKCPYDAITMYDTGERWPENMIPEGLRGANKALATKCDRCYDTGHDPACVTNCPHGCAVRVGSVEEFQKLLAKHD